MKKGNIGIFKEIRPYLGLLLLLMLVALANNGLNLWLPKITAVAIDSFSGQNFEISKIIYEMAGVSVIIFIFALGQSFLQTFLAETVAKNTREKLVNKISEQDFGFVNKVTPEKLLTIMTSDVDNIKQAMTMGLVQIFSSAVLVVGSAVMLLRINVKLGLIVLVIVPIVGLVFFNLFGHIRSFFKRAQAVLDRLNKVIKESIVAAALVRIINSQNKEIDKFNDQNSQAKDLGLSIMKLFSGLIPTIGLLANSTVILILLVGGKLILAGEFTVGDLTAFNTYVSMLIFPMIMLGFVSNIIARAVTSYQRIEEVLNFEGKDDFGDIDKEIKGKVEFKNVSLSFGQKQVLKEVSFEIKPGSKTAILGPTAAGKTQIFYLMSGLMKPNSGEILIDDVPVKKYCQKCLSGQLGLVFQDSSLFNLTIKENINFQNREDETNLKKAIETAALDDFIKTLSDGLETKITERGSNLSGGQKQRLTLARALAVNPKILLLDDFTARVDRSTEKDIFTRLKKNYGNITQVLITQQIASVEDFDQIILIMDGEVLAKGTHKELLKKSPEYQQLYSLQMSTE
ncbi:MAG: ABC transporter ATP-binding protein/permease [Candidatus Shapirobacteria bacterium]|nr:ABC transporter ATP-binding protein/permease [Candidatus Shapirobacteria bacterium]